MGFEILQKLKCKHCGSTWFEARAIMMCELLIDDNGVIYSMAEKPEKIERLPSYYRCKDCGKLTKDNRIYL